ncbi:hypothetical protein INP83_12790 [Mucilaginibacter sp. 21P]|uniref:hypothetical protein n=1 Tax=Mucilaginibacter sp. 21P TaxID=2778902 RepID=UPI001C5755F6|nr:hypothetical protein [Mucilaginibacter sp. 21P]QXV63975.1 hypothetical protein INP83_12790 [Mucilaginibacter sp. 21P]
MKSKLFEQKPKTAKTETERWVRVFPDTGEGHRLYDVLQERAMGRILFDADENWIYDGTVLTIAEQEEVAGFINGNQKEMNELIRDLYEK